MIIKDNNYNSPRVINTDLLVEIKLDSHLNKVYGITEDGLEIIISIFETLEEAKICIENIENKILEIVGEDNFLEI